MQTVTPMNSTRNILVVIMRHHLAATVCWSLVVAGLFFPALPAPAQLINLHFGANTYAGNTETTPATPTGPAGTWNNITATATCDTDVAVTYANGSAGPTLSLDAGQNGNWNSTSLAVQSVDYTTAGGVYDVANLYESGFSC